MNETIQTIADEYAGQECKLNGRTANIAGILLAGVIGVIALIFFIP